MFNVLLDRLPDNYNGYLIRTDFRIGIQMSLCLDDPDLTDIEKHSICINLLFGEGVPEYKTAINGITWFLQCGQEKDNSESINTEPNITNSSQPFDFDEDGYKILTAFKRAYSIDLKTCKLHWFEFISMLSDLGDCFFNTVVDYRTADTSKMDKETAKFYNKMKERFAIKEKLSEEERQAISKFLSIMGE